MFAPKMREKKYYTMLDPLEDKYGTVVTALIYLASLFGDVLWSASILAALGLYSCASVGIGLYGFNTLSRFRVHYYSYSRGENASVAGMKDFFRPKNSRRLRNSKNYVIIKCIIILLCDDRPVFYCYL